MPKEAAVPAAAAAISLEARCGLLFCLHDETSGVEKYDALMCRFFFLHPWHRLSHLTRKRTLLYEHPAVSRTQKWRARASVCFRAIIRFRQIAIYLLLCEKIIVYSHERVSRGKNQQHVKNATLRRKISAESPRILLLRHDTEGFFASIIFCADLAFLCLFSMKRNLHVKRK